MIHPQINPPPAGEPRQPETSRALELGASTGSAPSTYERLRELVSIMLSIPEGQIMLDSHFVDDLGADSLDAVEMMLAVEDRFNFTEEIAEEDAIACKTIADAVALIDRLALPNVQAEPYAQNL